MIDINDNLRQLYKNDSLPNVSELSYKQLFLYFPDLDLTITNDQIVTDSFSLDESLCSETDLVFGACEAAQLRITVADIIQDLKGQEVIVTQKVNGTYQMPLGTYKVDSAKKQSDLRFKDIVAHDQMTKFDIDVSAWYNGLSFPTTLRNFRLSLCSYIGVAIVEQTLPNDSMQVYKTISPTVLSGRDVLRKIAEINGCFGHITRDNKLKFIGLSAIGLYPTETLYPSEDLFPSENSEYIGGAGYKDCQFEEYEVQSIEKLQIREQEGDIGITVGSGSNGYIIEGNFLVYGKSSADLTAIANNLYLMIKNKKYRPHTTNMVGLPYIEVGDAISIVTSTDVIETFVFKRTLTGIQALNDEISASGNETREQNFGIPTQLEQLKSQTMKVKADVDGLNIQVNGPGGLDTLVDILAGNIAFKVSYNDVIAAINMSPETIAIMASKLKLEGYTTINGNFAVDTNGNVSIKDGTLLLTRSFGGDTINLLIDDVVFFIEVLQNGSRTASMILSHDGIECESSTRYAKYGRSEMVYKASGVELFRVDANGAKVRGSSPITEGNKSSYTFPPESHGHSTGGTIGATFSSSSIGSSDLITFTNTSGADNAATAGYVNNKVASSSDKRLKQNGIPLEDVTESYMAFVPMEYEFKPMVGNQYKHFGLYAQDVIEIYPEDKYDLVGVDNISITDEQRELCPTGIYEINYNNLHALHIKMIQKHEKAIQELKTENHSLRNELSELKELLKERGVI